MNKPSTRTRLLLTIGVASIGIYFLALFVVLPRVHDSVLDEFSRQLLEIQLPEGTSRLGSISRVGLLQGSGNHCDYLAGVMVKAEIPKEQLRGYYSKNYQGDGTLQIIWLDEKGMYTGGSSSPTTIFALRDWVRDSPHKDTDVGVVFSFRSNLTSSFDYRCR